MSDAKTTSTNAKTTVIDRLRSTFASKQQTAQDRAAQREALVRAGLLGLY